MQVEPSVLFGIPILTVKSQSGKEIHQPDSPKIQVPIEPFKTLQQPIVIKDECSVELLIYLSAKAVSSPSRSVSARLFTILLVNLVKDLFYNFRILHKKGLTQDHLTILYLLNSSS